MRAYATFYTFNRPFLDHQNPKRSRRDPGRGFPVPIDGTVYVNMRHVTGYWSGQAPGAHRLQRRGGRGGAQVAVQALLPGPQGQGQH